MKRGKEFSSGDHVMWRNGAGRITGFVLRKAICRFGVSGRMFDASPLAPRFLVRRDETGELAVVAPDAMRLLPH